VVNNARSPGLEMLKGRQLERTNNAKVGSYCQTFICRCPLVIEELTFGPQQFQSEDQVMPAVPSAVARNRRATQPPAHFQRNPRGRGDITIICETVHYQAVVVRRAWSG
jgi:hypothetical protein